MGWKDSAYGLLLKSKDFVIDTGKKMWEGVKTVREVAWHYVASPAALQVSKGIYHVVTEDILPDLCISYALFKFQQDIDDGYEQNPEAWQIYYALQTANFFFQAGYGLYWLRQRQRQTARTAVLTIENNNAWRALRRTKPFTICEEEKCTGMRFFHGGVRDFAIFYITDLSFWGLSKVPVIGPYLRFLFVPLSIYHKGRYALASVMPEVCQRHALDYMDDNASLALSLGLIHTSCVFGASQGIALYTNLPASQIANAIDTLFLFPTIAMAARLELPTPVKRDGQTVLNPDPLAAYQRFMGFWVDVALYGLKKKVPELFKGKKPLIDWNKLVERLERIRNHRVTELARLVLINASFQSLERAKQDPVIRPFWENLCEALADTAEAIVEKATSWQLRALTSTDLTTKFSIKFARWYTGFPKSIIKIVAAAVLKKDVQNWLRKFAQKLKEEKNIDEVASGNFFKREALSLIQVLERSGQIHHEDVYKGVLIIMQGLLVVAEPIRNKLQEQPLEQPHNPLKELSPPEKLTLKEPTNFNSSSELDVDQKTIDNWDVIEESSEDVSQPQDLSSTDLDKKNKPTISDWSFLEPSVTPSNPEAKAYLDAKQKSTLPKVSFFAKMASNDTEQQKSKFTPNLSQRSGIQPYEND